MIDDDALFTECWFLALVQAAIADFPTGWIEKSESPDFVVRTEAKLLGIEVCRLVRTNREGASSTVQQEVQQRHTLANATNLARARGLPPLFVRVLFGSNPPIRSRREVAEQLVETVACMVPDTVDETATLRSSWRSPISPPHVRVLHVTRIPPEHGHQWITASGGFPESGFQGGIGAAIEDKAGKLPSYLSRCDECWLIVGGDGRSAASSFEAPDGFEPASIESPFARTFFVDGWSGAVIELGVRERSESRTPSRER